MIYRHYATPEAVARAVAEEAFVRPSREDRVHLYWVDERCVPPTDVESNYGMTKETLLRHIPIPEGQVHRIAGEKDPEREAKDYSWLVGSELPFDGEYPIFDVVILGLGDDGHTSSIFPHQMELLETDQPYAVGVSPRGQKRVAMTGPTILAAKKLLFHATGQKKAPILRAIASSAPEADRYPATYIFRHRSDVELYTDVKL